MNIFLQIGLGLFPGAVAMLVLFFKRRAFRLCNFVCTVFICGVCGVSCYVGIKASGDAGEGAHLSKEQFLSFANALYLEGAYDEALEVSGEYSAVYGYDDECRLLAARICLAKGDYARADGLYRYLEASGEAAPGEAQYASFKSRGTQVDLAMMEYLVKSGEPFEDYGLKLADYQEAKDELKTDWKDIFVDVAENIRQAYEIDGISEYAKAVGIVSAESGASGSGQPVESGEDASGETALDGSENYRAVLERAQTERPMLFTLACVKNARMKAYALSKDFDQIAYSVGDNASYQELMVASELYMGKLVDKDKFAGSNEVDEKAASDVKKQLEKNFKNCQEGMTVQAKNQLQERMDAVMEQFTDPALADMQRRLAEAVETEAGTDRTKVYLQLAKIAYYFGNEQACDQRLNEAVYNSQDCKDDTYTQAMAQIINIIDNHDSDNTENIKNVSDYVETVLDRSLDVDIEGIISPGGQSKTVGNDWGSSEESGDWESPDEDDDWKDTDEIDRKSDIQRTVGTFAQEAVDYVSRAKSAVTIGKIDTSSFPQVSARVQFLDGYADTSDVDALKSSIRVSDCGEKIDSFALKEIKYDASNICLCCDISGSMQGSIQDLQNAVSTFIVDKNPKERIAAVAFSDAVTAKEGFGASDEDLLSFAENMSSSGGTDMFSAVKECLADFSGVQTGNNVLILITDGQDNNPKSEDEINQEIGALAREKDVTIYTLGLGDGVDTAYLETIAQSGNGDFIYVSDSVSLNSFYKMLHGQLNQYELSYEASDTVTMSGRTLEVELPSQNARCVKTYHLQDAGSGQENEDSEREGSSEGANGLAVTSGISIVGLSPRSIYKGQQNVEVKLVGSGFSKDSAALVNFKGNINYKIQADYVDEETYRLTIPASIALGAYDVEVSLGNGKSTLRDGFLVTAQGDQKGTAFGPYVFSSSEVIEDADETRILRGSVEMNGWLHFKGDVIIKGDISSGQSVNVSDESGAYVEFDEATAQGLGKVFAKKGVSFDLPALHDFKLYNDQAHMSDYANYMADDIPLGILKVYQLIRVDTPSVRLYPDSIGLYYTTGTAQLPYLDRVLNMYSKGGELFKFSAQGSAQITDKNVGIVLDVSYKDTDKSDFNHSINLDKGYNQIICLFNDPVHFNGSFKFKINTIKSEYLVGAMIRLAFFAEHSGIGAEISWEDMLKIDSVKLSLDLKNAKKVYLPGAVPIEVNNFTFQASDIYSSLKAGNILGIKFSGSATLSTPKLTSYFPALEEYLGNPVLLQMPDTKASIQLSPLAVEAEAKLNFLEKITLAQAGVKIGNFHYSNELLELDSESVKGFFASLKAGFIWKADRISVDISGTGELDWNSRFVGAYFAGDVFYDFRWWIINMEGKRTEKVALGLYTTDDGKKEFVLVDKFEKKGKIKGNFYYIDENGHCGKDNGYLK